VCGLQFECAHVPNITLNPPTADEGSKISSQEKPDYKT
jgi:hypothetical protein